MWEWWISMGWIILLAMRSTQHKLAHTHTYNNCLYSHRKFTASSFSLCLWGRNLFNISTALRELSVLSLYPFTDRREFIPRFYCVENQFCRFAQSNRICFEGSANDTDWVFECGACPKCRTKFFTQMYELWMLFCVCVCVSRALCEKIYCMPTIYIPIGTSWNKYKYTIIVSFFWNTFSLLLSLLLLFVILFRFLSPDHIILIRSRGREAEPKQKNNSRRISMRKGYGKK